MEPNNTNNIKKILWIEDDNLISTILGNKIRASGLELIHVSSAEKAIDVLKDIVPDIIVVDILLPGNMDGLGLILHIKGDKRLQNVPILVLSNISEKESIDRARSLGIKGFMNKPVVSMEQIIQNIKTYIQ
jgi:CheY-like chemotaxis protein